jgi:hypothetical protein
LFFEKDRIRRASGVAQLVLDLYSQLPNSFNADTFSVVLMAINCKEQIGDKSPIDLNHHSILTSCNKVVNPQVAFPPTEKDFDFPSEFINFSNLLPGQVSTVSCDPVVNVINSISTTG